MLKILGWKTEIKIYWKNSKLMYCHIDDTKILEKCKTIWTRVFNLRLGKY